MKIFKKITFLQIFALSLILFSCASTPKTEEKLPKADISTEEIPEPEDSSENKNNGITQEPELSENTDSESNQEQDFSDLTEPLTQEQNPDLPELPELSQETKKEEKTYEPSTIPEPQVKDAVAAENNENQTPQNQNEEQTAEQNKPNQNQQNIQPENAFVQTENNDSSYENQTDKNENSEDSESTDTIEETETSQESDNTNQQEEIQKPSRSVTIKKNQNIDIVYPGKGWIYQGNIDENGNIDSRNKNFIFGGRKLGGKDTSFTLRSRNPGTYLLHFFKNDTLTGKYIDDLLEVIVQNETSNSAEHITAPNYAEIVPPKISITAETAKNQAKKTEIKQNALQPEKNKDSEQQTEQRRVAETVKNTLENSKTSEIDTIIQTTESAPGNSSPSVKSETSMASNRNWRINPQAEETVTSESSESVPENSSSSMEDLSQDSLLELAKKYYDEKKYQQAFSTISKFFDKATERLDEGLFLQGQILEEKSPVQNIKSAIESYDLVVNNYPASSLWDKANKRSIFLKRFYINIR